MIHIPVALATDNNYIPLVATLMSLIKSANKGTFYDIYILIDNMFLKETREAIEHNFGKYKGQCSIIYKNVGHTFDGVSSKYERITRPTFYRLALPDLLNEDRCIYLDTDIIVRSDLGDLYNTPLDGCYVAGARHPGFILSAGKEEFCKTICLPDIEQYINAGVLVFNLEEMRKDDLVRRFLALIPKDFPTQDQDIINRVCYGKMAFIPFKYNVMTQCADWCVEDYRNIYSEVELKEAWNKPGIIHYAHAVKPWNCTDCVFMDYWWKICRSNRILDGLAHEFFKDFVIDAVYHSDGAMFTKNMPKIFDLTFKRNYVVYGAGRRAREFISFMRRTGIAPEFIVVSNIEKNESEIDGIEVRNIEDIGKELSDKTVIIATRQIFHKEIIKRLQCYDYQELLPVSDGWRIKDE